MGKSRTVSVYVTAEFSDYASVDLSEIDTDDLVAELEERLKTGSVVQEDGVFETALDAIRRGDTEYAELLLERAIHPKWKSREACMADLKARGAIQ